MITNSTITENNGVIGGGINFGSGGSQTLTIANGTVSHNNSGSGIDALATVTVILRNTIIANNGGDDCTVFLGGSFPSTANNYNLDSDGKAAGCQVRISLASTRCSGPCRTTAARP